MDTRLPDRQRGDDTQMNNGLCIFGEVLFDHFPGGQRVLGGAPFNVAWHLQAFSQAPTFISRIGMDPDGDSVIAAMNDWHMNTSSIQRDPRSPTGSVNIVFVDSEPVYDIVEPSAYDFIMPITQGALSCRLLYHGSLALRNTTSRQALEQLREQTTGCVFIDVNLRSPWWQREAVLEMVQHANWIKLNIDELNLLHESTDVDAARSFLQHYELDGLILTLGSAGAEIITADGEHHQVTPDSNTHIVDTVGAGDAFASVIILGLLNDWPIPSMLQRAQAFATAIVGQRGATVSEQDFYQTFIDAWNL